MTKINSKLLLLTVICSSSILLSCNTNYNRPYLDKSETIQTKSEKGAVVTAKITFRNFNIKANANGTPGKTSADIASYDVYLIKHNASTFPSGGDPLNTSNIVIGPVNLPVSDITADISFRSVPASTTSFGSGGYYFVAVRAYDSSSNDLIKENNNWTGTTASTPNVALSSSGVQVRESDLSVDTTTPLPVTLDLLDGTGVHSNVRVTIASGNYAALQSYSLNLCTDPARPFTTKVWTSPLIINVNSSSFFEPGKHMLNVTGIDAGTYYAVVSGYDSPGGTGNNISQANNGGAVYAGADAGYRGAVSANTITVTSGLTYNFSSGNNFDVNLNLNP